MSGNRQNKVDTSQNTWSIADLAREFDVSARTLRHYEDQGLLAPTREGQNRIYSAADRTKLSWILRGKRVGFSLAEIAEMLDLYNLDDGRATQRLVTIEKCSTRVAALKAQRDDLDSLIHEMTDFITLLQGLTACPETGEWLDAGSGEAIQDKDSLSIARFQTRSHS